MHEGIFCRVIDPRPDGANHWALFHRLDTVDPGPSGNGSYLEDPDRALHRLICRLAPGQTGPFPVGQIKIKGMRSYTQELWFNTKDRRSCE